MTLETLISGQYIYLIQERESIRCNDNVYKIGKTTQEPNSRMKGYPKSSKLYITIIVDDCTKSEKDLLTIFRNKFILRPEFGNEYFYGNVIEMMEEIIKYQKNNYKQKNEVQKEVQTSQPIVNNNSNEIQKEVQTSQSTMNNNHPNKVVKEVQTSQPIVSNNPSNEVKTLQPIVNNNPSNETQTSQSTMNNNNHSNPIKIPSELSINKNPPSLAAYTKKIAETILDPTNSALIHVNYIKDNLFEVDAIDIYDNKKILYRLPKENIPWDLDHNPDFIQLNEYHVRKYKKVEQKNHKKYLINICSFKLNRFKGIKYYKTLFLIDNDNN